MHLTHTRRTHTLVRYLTSHCLAQSILRPDINPSRAYMLPFLQRLRRKTIQDKRRKQSTVKKRAQAMARNEEKLRVATQSFVAANEMVRTSYCVHKIPTHVSGPLRICRIRTSLICGRVSRSPTLSTLFSVSLTHFSHPTSCLSFLNTTGIEGRCQGAGPLGFVLHTVLQTGDQLVDRILPVCLPGVRKFRRLPRTHAWW